MSQRKQRVARKERIAQKQVALVQPAVARFKDLRPFQALMLPLGSTLLLVAVGVFSSSRQSFAHIWSFLGAGAVLVAWWALLLTVASRRARVLTVNVVLRNQHYIQAFAQLSVFLYWGWYWREVYDSVHLIAAQVVFAYAFDMLLTWSRRDTYVLGFGPFPIIFSINLFLWFRPEWFYLQFLMVAVGFVIKELVRWNKEGRRVHIFNPSSFPLGVFAVILFMTDTTHLTRGVEIATTQLFPPHIFMLIFLVSLPAQFLFGVASMTLSAVATTYAFAVAYTAATGEYFFLVPSVPIAVFLGMHLLFNDPSTSPRTELGRIVFGVLYGLSVVALFALLDKFGAPTFYDKLLAVPVLNLMIQGIDWTARSRALNWLDPSRLGKGLMPRRRNLGYMSVWAVLFWLMQFQTGTEVALARGDALLSQGQFTEAITQYRELVSTEPEFAQAYNGLGYALLTVGRTQEAVVPLRRSLELQPDSAEAHSNLAFALIQAGRPEEAVSPLRQAVALEPAYSEAHYNLAHALIAVGQPHAAIQEFSEALRLQPDWPAALRDFSSLLATHPDIDVRNPTEAVRLASRALEVVKVRAEDPRFVMNEREDALILDALSAAYAATGQFEDAIQTAEQAEVLAARSDPTLAAQIGARLVFYREGQLPF